MDGRHCKIDMVADVHWEMVLIASNAETTSLLVLEEMVLGVEQTLRLLDGTVKLDLVAAFESASA